MKLINKKRKFFLITFITIVLLGILFVLTRNFILNTNRNINVSGTVIDLETNRPLSGISVVEGNKRIITKEDGLFEFDQVSSNGTLVINGGLLYEDVYIPISNRKNIEIFLSDKILTTLRDLENYEQNRQYRKLYSILSGEIKGKYTEEEYLKLKNTWRDDITVGKEYNLFKIAVDRSSLKRVSDQQASVSAVYQWGKDGKVIYQYGKEINLIIVDGKWFIYDDLLKQ